MAAILDKHVERLALDRNRSFVNLVRNCTETVNRLYHRVRIIEERLGEPKCPTCGRSTK